MSQRRRYDQVRLDVSKARRRDSDGALIVPGRFARTGLQPYNDGQRVEYRSKEEVLASASTFEDVATTDRHPSGNRFVDADNWDELGRGHMSGIHPVEADGETWLEARVVISAGKLADAVEQGRRSELSAGYYCDYIEGEGEYNGTPYHGIQTAIVGNHVAVLGAGEARAGPGARMMLDSDDNEIPPATPGRKEDRMTIKIASRRVDYDVEGAGAEGLKTSLEIERGDSASVLKAAEDKASAAEARADAATKEIADLKTELANATDPVKIAKDAADLRALGDRSAVVAGTAINLDGTPHDVRVAALKAGGLDILSEIPEGRKTDSVYTETFVAARFDAEHTARSTSRQSQRGHVKTEADRKTNDGDRVEAALARKDAMKRAESRRIRGLPAEVN